MKNMGNTDRIIRLISGIILIAAGILLQVRIGRLWWIGLVGAVLTGTALISFCPLYLPFGISTRKSDS